MAKKNEYYLDFSREIRKSIIIYQVKGSVHSPVAYISRPKWINEKDFEKFVRSLTIYAQ